MPVFIATGDDEATLAGRRDAVRGQIAFYGSTPAYRPVLDHHGWGDLQTELNRLTKAGRWSEIGDAVDDTVLDTFAIVCTPEELPDRLAHRYGGLLDRILLTAPVDGPGVERWAPIFERIRAL